TTTVALAVAARAIQAERVTSTWPSCSTGKVTLISSSFSLPSTDTVVTRRRSARSSRKPLPEPAEDCTRAEAATASLPSMKSRDGATLVHPLSRARAAPRTAGARNLRWYTRHLLRGRRGPDARDLSYNYGTACAGWQMTPRRGDKLAACRPSPGGQAGS